MPKYIEVNDQLRELVSQKKTGRQISEILHLNYTTVHRKLRKLGLTLYNYHNELKFNNKVFDSIDSEEKAYWLGFLYADGYVSSRDNAVELSLKGDDYDHLMKFNTFLQNKGAIPKKSQVKVNGKVFTRCRLQVTDKHFHDQLIQLGCIPKKSLVLKFPNESIFKNVKLIYPFIRGYIDGDGCLYSTDNGRLVISVMGTKEFLNGIKDWLPQITRSLHKRKGVESNTFALSVSRNKADCVADLLYKNATIYLNRKYKIFCRLTQKYVRLQQGKNGEDCDVNTVLTEQITKGCSVVQSVGGE